MQAWDTNSENGKYLTGIEAQRVIVEGMRKKVETMKTLMTPAMSNKGNSMFNFPIGNSIHSMRSSAHSINSLSSYNMNDEVFRGEVVILNSIFVHIHCSSGQRMFQTVRDSLIRKVVVHSPWLPRPRALSPPPTRRWVP